MDTNKLSEEIANELDEHKALVDLPDTWAFVRSTIARHLQGVREEIDGLRQRRLPNPRIIERIEQRSNKDCLRCCVAMVTGVDYDDVPDFCESAGEAWPTACNEWLNELGMGLLMFGSACPDFVPSWLPIIAQGPSNISPKYHFVVVTEDAIIDPWPSQPGLKEIKERYAIVNSGSLANGFIDHIASKYAEANQERDSLRTQLSQAVDELKIAFEEIHNHHSEHWEETVLFEDCTTNRCMAARDFLTQYDKEK